MSRLIHRIWSLCFLLCLGSCGAQPEPSLLKLSSAQLQERLRWDGRELEHSLRSMEALLAQAQANSLLSMSPKEMVKERVTLQRFFASFLDHIVRLEALRLEYAQGRGLETPWREEAFLLAYSADLAFYLGVGTLLKEIIGRQHYEKLLDDPQPELGLPKGAWRALKTRFNLQPWQRPLLLAQAQHQSQMKIYRGSRIQKRQAWLMNFVERRWPDMLALGLKHGGEILVKEWGDLAWDGFRTLWFPTQSRVARWMGDTRLRSQKAAHISLVQLEEFRALLRPGDILLERRNGYLSNLGLPGFWPHAVLYLGTPEEAEQALGSEALAIWERAHPQALARWRERKGADPIRVIEAVSEGVIFNSLEHSAQADYLAALRPRLPPAEIIQAIQRALGYQGLPYDFDFDFLSDASLVCTELVYKSYEPQRGEGGLKIPLVQIMGRPTLPANEIAKLYAKEYGAEGQQLEFLGFLDGREESQTASFAGEEIFRASYKRPRWDLLQP